MSEVNDDQRFGDKKLPERPFVSIVIPSYNHARFLEEAITSALNQSHQSAEVIVVDDGSTDDTLGVVAEFRDRIVYLRQANQGLSVARNTGILEARGEFIQLLDADDALCPGTLDTLAEAVACRPQGAVFFASWDEIDLDGHVTAHVDATHLPGDAFHALFNPIAVGPPCRYLVRRSAFARVGLFDNQFPGTEDWDMWLRMAVVGLEFVAVPAACSSYRNYPTSMSKEHGLMWRSGNSVLQRAAGYHRNCYACRLAKKQGVRRWREWCYFSMLAPQLRELQRAGNYDLLGRCCIGAFRRDPWILPALVRPACSRGRRVLAAQFRARRSGRVMAVGNPKSPK